MIGQSVSLSALGPITGRAVKQRHGPLESSSVGAAGSCQNKASGQPSLLLSIPPGFKECKWGDIFGDFYINSVLR